MKGESQCESGSSAEAKRNGSGAGSYSIKVIFKNLTSSPFSLPFCVPKRVARRKFSTWAKSPLPPPPASARWSETQQKSAFFAPQHENGWREGDAMWPEWAGKMDEKSLWGLFCEWDNLNYFILFTLHVWPQRRLLLVAVGFRRSKTVFHQI